MSEHRIVIEVDDSRGYAEIDASGLPRHWVERSGAYWVLQTGNAFDTPRKRWPATAKRQTVDDVIPDALAVILRSPRGPKPGTPELPE